MSGANGYSNNRPATRVSSGDSHARVESQSCGIAIMAKASAPGRAKTRLVPPLNFEEAAAFNTAFLQDMADNLLLAGRETNLAAYAAFGPAGSERFFRKTLPDSIGLIDAWLPSFGECLKFTIEEILHCGHGAAVVLNSDSPTLPTSLLVQTAEALARPGDRAILGPSSDGGYYLLGLKHAHRRMFEDIAWSTERVAEQTLARAKEINLEVHVLPTWYDVDDVDALRKLHAEFSAPKSSRAPLAPYRAPHTAALMDRLCRQADLVRRISRFTQREELHA